MSSSLSHTADNRRVWRAGVLHRLVELPLLWMERSRDRRFLDALSDHQLRDIGVNRAMIETETAKPFWRA
jgi:uncharacterized protein YjiS (DUF1127 family)